MRERGFYKETHAESRERERERGSYLETLGVRTERERERERRS